MWQTNWFEKVEQSEKIFLVRITKLIDEGWALRWFTNVKLFYKKKVTPGCNKQLMHVFTPMQWILDIIPLVYLNISQPFNNLENLPHCSKVLMVSGNYQFRHKSTLEVPLKIFLHYGKTCDFYLTKIKLS